MFVLQLNDMRLPKSEMLGPVARSEKIEDLIKLMDDEKVPEYLSQDNRWRKQFRQGGPLEWFNPPMGEVHLNDEPYILNLGTAEDWATQARADYEKNVMSIPDIPTLRTVKVVELDGQNSGLGPVV
jgi:hypothetical protein